MRGVPLRLGLTGGIGSGKSTVAAVLERRGATVVDADAISRAATAPGGSAMAAITDLFGPAYIGADGGLDRSRMRSLVFSDPSARLRLEQVMHPLIREEILRQTDHARMAGARCIVHDIPLLVESSRWRSELDSILVVDCSPETQIQRVLQRSGLPRPQVEAILASQANRQLRLRAADHVICNEGMGLQALEHLVNGLAPRFGL